MTDEELQAAGLYDPATDLDTRPRLLRFCLQAGLSLDELRAAGDDLVQAAVFHSFGAREPHLTLAELAERAGVDVELARQLQRSIGIGLPDDDRPLYTEKDVRAFTLFAGATSLFGADALEQILRVTGASIGRIGDTTISTFVSGPGVPAIAGDESGIELLEANMAAMDMLPIFGEWLGQLLARYVRLTPRDALSAVDLAALQEDGVDTLDMAIGFADLVGSTTLADRRSLAELSKSLDEFERTAADAVVASGGRVVKFIGDEVMFRSPTAADAGRLALDLVDLVRDNELLPPLRVGLAFGEVLTRGADYYGPVVNLAARITKLAPLHGVVATAETGEALADDDDIEVDSLGAIEVSGLGAPVELAALSRRR